MKTIVWKVSRCVAVSVAGWFVMLVTAHPAFSNEVITAGSPPSSAPMTFLDVRTNTIEGVMPDIMREVAKREKFDVRFEAVPFPALIESTVSGKIDVIVSAMTPTARRAEVVDFASVVYSFGEGMVLPDKDHQSYGSAKELGGKTIGALTGTTYGDALGKLGIFKEVKYYDTTPDLLTDMRTGRLDAGFADAPILAGLEMNGKLGDLHIDRNYVPLSTGGIAIAVKKGNKALLDRINAGIASMRADGSLDAILRKWHLK